MWLKRLIDAWGHPEESAPRPGPHSNSLKKILSWSLAASPMAFSVRGLALYPILLVLLTRRRVDLVLLLFHYRGGQ